MSLSSLYVIPLERSISMFSEGFRVEVQLFQWHKTKVFKIWWREPHQSLNGWCMSPIGEDRADSAAPHPRRCHSGILAQRALQTGHEMRGWEDKRSFLWQLSVGWTQRDGPICNMSVCTVTLSLQNCTVTMMSYTICFLRPSCLLSQTHTCTHSTHPLGNSRS